jgi:hypothetical protein
MKKLLRIFGLVVAIGLVSFTAVGAYPVYDNCSYTCSGGGSYSTWTTMGDCCGNNPSALWCPPGESPTGITFGGYYYYEQFCWF